MITMFCYLFLLVYISDYKFIHKQIICHAAHALSVQYVKSIQNVAQQK